MLDLIRTSFSKVSFNSNAGGWSRWTPKAVKSILWETVLLKRLHIFSLLSSISFLYLLLKWKLKKILALQKICSRRPIFNFHTFFYEMSEIWDWSNRAFCSTNKNLIILYANLTKKLHIRLIQDHSRSKIQRKVIIWQI